MQILGWATVVVAYCAMVWGNIVSATGSGLACPDWPLCHGTVTPPMSTEIVLEWGHRLLAATAGIFIIATVYQALTSEKATPSLKRSGKALLCLLGLQVLLGGTTVLLGLSPAVSTIHLLVATLVFSGLITVACVMTWQNPIIQQNVNPKIARLAVAGLFGMFAQFAMGGMIRHTQSGLACPNFPACLDSFFPIPLFFSTALAFVHRWWGVLLLGVFVQLAIVTAKTCPPLARTARRALGLSLAQVVLGIGVVLGHMNTHSRATHAAVGYALWGVLFYLAVRAGGFSWIWKKEGEAA